jgi:phosphosulfolactate synthase (CoM biosynthesis protein A)
LDERAFPFVRINRRETKPRQRGLTEIRGPYYSVMGARYLTDLLETMGEYVDGVKYAGGSFALMPRQRVQELNDLAHRYNAYVSTGGWVEHVLAHGSPDDVHR